MFEFLKKVRKRTEKLVQQAKGKEKEKDRAREMRERNNRDREERRRQGVHHQQRQRQGNEEGGEEGDRGRVRNMCLIHPRAAHLTRKCNEFKNKSPEERGQLVRDLNACKLCLSIQHLGQPCPNLGTWNPFVALMIAMKCIRVSFMVHQHYSICTLDKCQVQVDLMRMICEHSC